MRVEVWYGAEPLVRAAVRRLRSGRSFVELRADPDGAAPGLLYFPRHLVLSGVSSVPLLPGEVEHAVLIPLPACTASDVAPPGARMRRFSSSTPADLGRLASWFAPGLQFRDDILDFFVAAGPSAAARWLQLLPFASDSDAELLAGPAQLPEGSAILALLGASSPKVVDDISRRFDVSSLLPLLMRCVRSELVPPTVSAEVFRLSRISPPAAVTLLAAHLR